MKSEREYGPYTIYHISYMVVEWLIHGGRSTQSESDESEYGAVSGQSEYLTKATSEKVALRGENEFDT